MNRSSSRLARQRSSCSCSPSDKAKAGGQSRLVVTTASTCTAIQSRSRTLLTLAGSGTGDGDNSDSQLPPAPRRCQSAGSIHELTWRHNDLANRAEHLGTCVAALRESGKECECHVCRSPRGSWRCDSIEATVGKQLEQLATAIRSDPSTVCQSPGAQRELASGPSLPDHSPDRPPVRRLLPASTWEDSPMGGVSLSELLTSSVRQAPRSRPGSAPAGGRRAGIAANGGGGGRPTSAKASEHVREVFQRHVQLDSALHAKRLAAWDTKMATIDGRLADRCAQAAELRDAKQREAIEKEEMAQRLKMWITVMHASCLLQCMWEFAVCGRILNYASSGGEVVQRVLSQGMVIASPRVESLMTAARGKSLRRRVTAVQGGSTAHSRALVPRSHGRPVMIPLLLRRHGEDPDLLLSRHVELADRQEAPERRRQGSTNHLRWQLGRVRQAMAVVAALPRTWCLAELGQVDNWEEYIVDMQAALSKSERVFHQWSVLMVCLRVLIILRRKLKYRRAAEAVKTFLRLFNAHGRLHLAAKTRLCMVRKVQEFWRAWLASRMARRDLAERMFREAEEAHLKRQWAEEDMGLIQQERRKLFHLRSWKEIQSCERVIKVATENYMRHRAPKTEADRIYVRLQFEKQCLPAHILAFAARLAVAARHLLLRFEFRKRERIDSIYLAELQAWQDIEQAVQLLDPSSHNPAPKPQKPTSSRLPMVIEEAGLKSVVRRLQQFYVERRDQVDAQAKLITHLLPETPAACERALFQALAAPDLACVDAVEASTSTRPTTPRAARTSEGYQWCTRQLSPRQSQGGSTDVVLEVAARAFERAARLPRRPRSEALQASASTYKTVCALIVGLTLLPAPLREQIRHSTFWSSRRLRRRDGPQLNTMLADQASEESTAQVDEILVPSSPAAIAF